MPPTPRRAPSLVPVIVGLAVLLVAALIALLIVRGGDDSVPPAPTPDPAVPSARGPERSTSTVGTSPRTIARRATGADRTTSTTAADTTSADARAAERARWPLTGAAAQRTRVPILMYHLIANAPADTAYPDLWVAPDRFRAQIAALKDAGFTAITMQEMWDAWHEGGRLPRRPIVLSFDDGDITHAMNAAPVLLQAGWPGVLNLTVDHLGEGGLPMWGAKRLIRQGWEIGSHSATHPNVTTLDAAGLTRELAGSRRTIKQKLGVDPRFFCYPAGKSDAASRAAVQAAGYHAATTVDPGLAAKSDDPFLLPRVRVDPDTTPTALVKMIR